MKFLRNLVVYFTPQSKEEAELGYLALGRAGQINFNIREVRDGSRIYFVAESNNLKDKEIITAGDDIGELDRNIKDAILTAFHIPRRYSDPTLVQSGLAREKTELRYATR